MQMPGGRGTPHAAFRIAPALWERFREASRMAGAERSAVLRQLIAWYLGEAELPKRPIDELPDDL